MLQLVYVSTVRPGIPVDLPGILATSRRHNLADGITGLLHANDRRFLQVLEGDPARVEATYARIAADPRHFALVVLSRRTIAAREFGDWSMAYDDGRDRDAIVARVGRLVEGAAPTVRGTFEGFVKLAA